MTRGGPFRAIVEAHRFLVLLAVVLLVPWVAAWGAAKALCVRVPLDRADAIVVMAGSGDYRERSDLAAAVYRAGRAPLVVITDEGTRAGWFPWRQTNPKYLDLTRERLVRGGVERSSIVALPPPPPGGLGTLDELRAVIGWARAHRVHSVLVVTSSYHSRRVGLVLRRELGREIAFGVEPVTPQRLRYRPATWWIFPFGWRAILSEYVKLGYYSWYVSANHA